MKSLMTLLITLLGCLNLCAQMTCDELTEIIKDKGDNVESDYCFGDEALSQIDFYKLEVDYVEYYFAVVTFKSNPYQEYTYQIPQEAMNDYIYNFSDEDIEKFWKYIQPYNSILDCSPYERRGNKYKPKY